MPRFLFAAILALLPAAAAAQSTLDTIGVSALRAAQPSLTGSGVTVGQVEAQLSTNAWEVNPAATGQSASGFTFTSSAGSAVGFPNNVGLESSHADTVADAFYGQNDAATPEGVAYGVSAVANYEAGYFYSNIVAPQVSISPKIVNQSFIFGGQDAQVDQDYDNYAARYNTLFISGLGNSGGPNSPATAYNGIGVAAYGQGAASSVGPASDGRSKPDLTAPAAFTSFSTPLVSGAAALLSQAAARGDGGASPAADASDIRTLKALLLDGAVKPADWAHTSTAPLDPRYGAGVLNVANSYAQLAAGEQTISASVRGAITASNTGLAKPDEGWNLSTITNRRVSGTYADQTDHYLIDLSAISSPSFTLTSTLVWERQQNQSAINNLDLYLFNAVTGLQLAVSDSLVDNVEELTVSGLSPGRYDLAVLKQGGSITSTSEKYALAFAFAPVPEPGGLALLAVGGAVLLWRGRRETAWKISDNKI